ncbi:substrate-binding domain-containing protein [Actimicrobium sp. CCC2.4]|uniref:substrate-binding domain-containing protein n=1 Tax=Actimicrobium sp. CCC2.4 TaxID=3048606 RepID=UPI002AC9AFDB|nr:substrate-binding domain-containing protein [Actimicrobium sp. CCC2.4]MEB0136804.1 substrate-binding domain-containing protein [Actimicrobium sp. CCC2.4]WPX33918.1 substrate-binding domain-containing protein [Actimicrobium sp. CCC2.4]
MKIEIRPVSFLLNGDDKPFSLVKGLALLVAIDKAGNLQAASKALAMSYRHAWDALADMETAIGAPVVSMSRGRGSVLTPLGQRLIAADRLIHARMDPLLASMANEIDADIQSAISELRDVLKIYASHGFAIEALNRRLQKEQVPLDLSYRGSLEAVSALSRGNCDVAGFHVPVGSCETAIFRHFAPLLKPGHRLIKLANRRQGIMVAKGNPKQIWHIADLLRPEVLFVNRQLGSGTRLIVDLLLAQEGKSGTDVNGYENTELTHAAVAAYILCGKADAGIGVETAARQFDLDFVPLLTERYFLVCDQTLLADIRFMAVMGVLNSNELRATVNDLPGYDVSDTGTILSVDEAFAVISAP